MTNEELVSRYTVAVYADAPNEGALREELLRRLAERDVFECELRAWRFAANGDTTAYDVAVAWDITRAPEPAATQEALL